MKKELVVIIFLICNISQAQIIEEVGGGVSDGSTTCLVSAIEVFNNELFISGHLDSAGSIRARGIARWNGVQWDSVGYGMRYYGMHAKDFCILNGELYAAGYYSGILIGLPNTIIPFTENLAKWDGTNWSAVSQFNAPSNINSIETYIGNIFIGGSFVNVGGASANKIAQWNGVSWNGLATGLSGGPSFVQCMTVFNNELYVSGFFTHAGTINVSHIARWDGNQWDSLGSGLDVQAYAMVSDTVNNILYVAGGFTQAGGIAALQVAKWDGFAWSSLDTVNLSWAYSLELYHGELYIGASNKMYKWNGATIQEICTVNGPIMCMKSFNDSLFFGGYFDTINNVRIERIARYYSPNLKISDHKKADFKIYPNPTANANEIQITYNPSIAYIKIYSSLGKLEREIKISELSFNNESAIISIENLHKGIFAISFFDINGIKIYSSKFIVLGS